MFLCTHLSPSCDSPHRPFLTRPSQRPTLQISPHLWKANPTSHQPLQNLPSIPMNPYCGWHQTMWERERERENKTILLLCTQVICSLVWKIFVLGIKFLKISFRCFPIIVLRICQKCFCSASQFSVFGNKFPNRCMNYLPSKKMDFI